MCGLNSPTSNRTTLRLLLAITAKSAIATFITPCRATSPCTAKPGVISSLFNKAFIWSHKSAARGAKPISYIKNWTDGLGQIHRCRC